jgi:predicted nucleotidyltransferase
MPGWRTKPETCRQDSPLNPLRQLAAQIHQQRNSMSTTKIHSAHPVSAPIRATITQALRDIEAQHNVTILYACESGSRAWGFASPDSDYDVRFIYAHRLPWYLQVEAGRDVIELPINDDLDINGWELRKTLGLLLRSNPVLPEWLDSPLVYHEEAQAVERLRSLTATYFSPQKGYWHYLSMAKRNFRDSLQGETVRLKKYLYVLRPLLAVRWIQSGQKAPPPMRFAQLAESTLTDAALIDDINRLLHVKMSAAETKYSPRWPLIHAFIESELQRFAETPPQAEPPHTPPAALDEFLLQTILAYTRHPMTQLENKT